MPYEWDYDSRLYHVTPGCNLSSVLSEGVRRGGAWFIDPDLAIAYAAEIRKEGESPVALSVSVHAVVSASRPGRPLPDKAFMAHPCIETLERSEAEILEEWACSKGGWKGCLEVFGSIICDGAMPPDLLTLEEGLLALPEDDHPSP